MRLNVGTPLAAESRFFEANRVAWAAEHPHKYVVIQGDHLIGFYDDFEAALEAGLQSHEMGQFLIKQVFDKEPVYAIF